MVVIKNEMVVMYDVDDTLVLWGDDNYSPGEDKVEIINPYDETWVFLRPHREHMQLMRKHKAQGYTIIVWSAGGFLWAEAVVKQLKLEDVVDLVMSKPMKYVDDLPANEILGSRVYISPGGKKS